MKRASSGSLGRRSLKRNFSAALAGNLIYTLCQFGMLVALTRITNPTEVGRYALAFAIAAPVFLLTSLKLRQVQVTDAAGLNTPGEFFALRWISSVVGFSVVCCIAVASGLPTATQWTIVGVGLFKAFESQIDILYGAMQRREQMHLVARAQIIRGVSGLALFSALLVTTERVEIAVAAIAVLTLGHVALNSLGVRRLGVSTKPALHLIPLSRLAWLALPLGLSVSLGSLATNVPRYFLQAFEGTATLGIFAALAYPLVATSLIASALSEAASPRLSNLYVAGDAAGFRSTFKKLVAIGIGIGIGAIVVAVLLGRVFLDLAFGSEYAEHHLVFVILIAGAAVQYSFAFVGTSVNAMRIFRVQAPISMVGLAAVAATAVWAVPAEGLTGAAWSLVAGQIVAGVCYLWVFLTRVSPTLTSLERRVE